MYILYCNIQVFASNMLLINYSYLLLSAEVEKKTAVYIFTVESLAETV